MNMNDNPQNKKYRFCTKCGSKLVPFRPYVCPICEKTIVPQIKFLAIARLGKNSAFRWTICIIFTIFIWNMGNIPFEITCEYLTATNVKGFTCNPLIPAITGPSYSLNFVLIHLIFIIGLIGFWFLLKLIHKKTLTSVMTGRSNLDIKRIVFSSLTLLSIYAFSLLIEVLISYFNDQSISIKYAGISKDFFLIMILAIFLVPIQVTLEEVFFRGYLIQGFSLLTNSKLVIVIAPSFIFAIIHLSNPEPWAYGVGPYLLSILLMGIFMSFITLQDGGIEIASGLHIANNLWVYLIIGLENSVVPTPSIFHITSQNIGYSTIIIPFLIQFVLLYLIFTIKYKWHKQANLLI
jgi:membrane protease YdiL (CAAX protease family)